jgi:hypothetical protein
LGEVKLGEGVHGSILPGTLREMATLPRTLLWTRLDVSGAEQVTFDDRRGLVARGVQVAVDPIPYACRYELYTDENWATARFEASAEGGGWLRTVRLEHAAGSWRVTTAEQGDLDVALRAAGVRAGAPLPGIDDPDRLADAFDVDLAGSPLTNTLPLRRLGFPAEAKITAAWVLLPSLAVVASEQVYTSLGPGRVRYASGSFAAEVSVDEDGFVVRYEGLAQRA